jgi:hypothetical protein
MSPFIKTSLKTLGLFGMLTMVACQKEDATLTSDSSSMETSALKAVDLPTAAATSASLVPESILNLATTPSAEELATQKEFNTRSKSSSGGATVYAYLSVKSLGCDKGCTLEPYGDVTAKLISKNYKDCYQTDYLTKRSAHDPYYIKENCSVDLKCVKYSKHDIKDKYLKLSGCLKESDCNKDDGYNNKGDDYLGDKSDCVNLDCKSGCYTVWQCYTQDKQTVYVKYVIYVH